MSSKISAPEIGSYAGGATAIGASLTLTQVGIIVGLGILLDTFLVRTVIIPALFTLIGPKIWWPALRTDDYRSDGGQQTGRHRAREAADTHPR